MNKSMTRQLGVFDFRAFLNLAMLVSESESERARLLRQAILLWNAQFIYSTVSPIIDTVNFFLEVFGSDVR